MPFNVGYLETITIQEISGTNVPFQYVRDLLNGTEETGVSLVDVSDGYGTGFFVIISTNVNAGDRLYPDWTNENQTSEGAPFVNETILMQYGYTHRS